MGVVALLPLLGVPGLLTLVPGLYPWVSASAIHLLIMPHPILYSGLLNLFPALGRPKILGLRQDRHGETTWTNTAVLEVKTGQEEFELNGVRDILINFFEP